jgi:hypothetical protein
MFLTVKAPEASDGPKKVTIVEFKRAYNVSIALAQFKAFPTYTDLLQAVFEVRSQTIASLDWNLWFTLSNDLLRPVGRQQAPG